jgi:pimeloyl-ACP methyl ester carboxylesterase
VSSSIEEHACLLISLLFTAPSFFSARLGLQSAAVREQKVSTCFRPGPPLVCLPGGRGRTCEYFGDLGGLSRSRQLIMPDTRGTGESADASDPLSYRCDRLAGDLEALRGYLGLDRMDLLGHSAAGRPGHAVCSCLPAAYGALDPADAWPGCGRR